jgi:penicillin-binding protein 1A
VWMGYDNPRSLGSRESGGGLSLPIWIDYMRTALQGVPEQSTEAPEGVVLVDGEWVYSEWAAGGQRTRIGFDEALPEPAKP